VASTWPLAAPCYEVQAGSHIWVCPNAPVTVQMLAATVCICFQFVSDYATSQLVQDPAACESLVCQAQHTLQGQATARSFC